jgi:hypothetical protein
MPGGDKSVPAVIALPHKDQAPTAALRAEKHLGNLGDPPARHIHQARDGYPVFFGGSTVELSNLRGGGDSHVVGSFSWG